MNTSFQFFISFASRLFLSVIALFAGSISFSIHFDFRQSYECERDPIWHENRAPHSPHSLIFVFTFVCSAQVPGAVCMCVRARACFQLIFVGRLKSNWFSFIGYALLAPVRAAKLVQLQFLCFRHHSMEPHWESWMGLRTCVSSSLTVFSCDEQHKTHENTFGWRANGRPFRKWDTADRANPNFVVISFERAHAAAAFYCKIGNKSRMAQEPSQTDDNGDDDAEKYHKNCIISIRVFVSILFIVVRSFIRWLCVDMCPLNKQQKNVVSVSFLFFPLFDSIRLFRWLLSHFHLQSCPHSAQAHTHATRTRVRAHDVELSFHKRLSSRERGSTNVSFSLLITS